MNMCLAFVFFLVSLILHNVNKCWRKQLVGPDQKKDTHGWLLSRRQKKNREKKMVVNYELLIIMLNTDRDNTALN